MPEFDALDAFITHMWSVTVTGAPKRNAIKWIEQNEEGLRKWYGGAIGFLTFNGNLNTGLTLRAMTIRNGIAVNRAGATLLTDSNPIDEEEETLTKAAALIQAIREAKSFVEVSGQTSLEKEKIKKNVLIVDHEDSFVHTLSGYFKQMGSITHSKICTANFCGNYSAIFQTKERRLTHR